VVSVIRLLLYLQDVNLQSLLARPSVPTFPLPWHGAWTLVMPTIKQNDLRKFPKHKAGEFPLHSAPTFARVEMPDSPGFARHSVAHRLPILLVQCLAMRRGTVLRANRRCSTDTVVHVWKMNSSAKQMALPFMRSYQSERRSRTK
jgi:hypothetical protein